MDCKAVYEKWLANVRLGQHEDGKPGMGSKKTEPYMTPRTIIPMVQSQGGY